MELLETFPVYDWYNPSDWLDSLRSFHLYKPAWLSLYPEYTDFFKGLVPLNSLTTHQKYFLSRVQGFYLRDYFYFHTDFLSGYISRDNQEFLDLYMQPRYQGFYSSTDYRVRGCPQSPFTQCYPDFCTASQLDLLKYNQRKLHTIKQKLSVKSHYGVTNPSQSKEIQDRKVATFQAHYGVSYGFQSKHVQSSIRNTMLSKYGAVNPSQVPEIRSRQQETNLVKYGCRVPTQSTSVRGKISATKIAKHSEESLLKLLCARATAVGSDFLYSSLTVSNGCDLSKPLSQWKPLLRCRSCHKDYVSTYGDGYLLRCPDCKVSSDYRSSAELEIENWLMSNHIKVEHKKAPFLGRYSLDLYLPDFNIGIEYNGLYWHSSACVPKEYHKTKTDLALSKGIKLYHFWEDSSLDFIKSFLSKKLGLSSSKVIYARKCQVVPDNNSSFISKYHRQGDCSATRRYSLIYNGQVVSAISYRVKGSVVENARYCTHPDFSVSGGFSKLLKDSINLLKSEYPNITKLVTYCDRDLTPDYKDSVYYRFGFSFIKDTGLEMRWFLKKSILGYSTGVYNRRVFQKHKLKSLSSYSDNATESEIMELSGAYQIWNSGCWKFELNL